MTFLKWLSELWDRNTRLGMALSKMNGASNLDELNSIYTALTPDEQNYVHVKKTYEGRLLYLDKTGTSLTKPFQMFIKNAMNDWLANIKKYETTDPVKAKDNLVKLTADIIEIAGTSAAIDMGLGLLPLDAGTTSSNNTKQILAWLGVGAVVNAVAHDPVKIGLLRPYQDSLEQTFRNKRPGDSDLFAAYQQRSLSATKIDDVDKITDELMTQIEKENDTFYDSEISKWGYSVEFSNALKDSATKTLSFGSLMTLARQGRLNRGMAIFSLWGYGLDKRLMKVCLEALEETNRVSNYEGFRSMIEPSYIEGDISEEDLIEYWTKIGVPSDIQKWVLPRMKKKRLRNEMKAAAVPTVKDRELTVSQIQQAYQNGLMKRVDAQNMILGMNYSMTETNILLDLADLKAKLPITSTLKKLPLSDYEKAYYAKIIKKQDVLDRMKGEYTQDDIAIEDQLLQVKIA